MTARPSYGAPTLGLWPDEDDVELPFPDLTGALHNETLGAVALAGEVMDLEAALADVLTALEDPRHTIPANRLRAYRLLAKRPEVPGIEDTTAIDRGVDGMTRAAARWTDEEAAKVDEAIANLARRRVVEDGLGIAPREFTSADVWAELGPGFPVTKGIAAKLLAAARAGLIANTGRHQFNDNPDREHAHGQRLSVWRAL